MSLNFKVSGLGKIKEGEFNLAKFTVITGPNGTGKSFFTKSIYSIFSTIENITTQSYINDVLKDTCECLSTVSESSDDSTSIENINYLINNLNKLQSSINFEGINDFSVETKQLEEFHNEIVKQETEFEKEIEVCG